MLLRELFHRLTPVIFEGGNLSSHDIAGNPTVGWTGIAGQHSAGKIDSENRKAMVPVVKQLLVDINNTFAQQYGRHIWNQQLIDQEVHTFISGSSKWFMFLRQHNPNFNPQQPESETNPKMIGIEDADFKRVKKKVGDIDTQIDRRLEPQIEEFVHKNIGKSVGSATLVGTKKGSDQWLALWQINEPPITLQVDLEFVDYTTDSRGFEIPTEWAQISHGSEIEDLNEGIKGVFRQWLYRSLAKVAPSDKYVAKVTGAGKNKAMRVFGGDDMKEHVTDYDNPPPPFRDANFSFAVASVGGGGVRAKYRAPKPEENVPKEINGIPVLVPLTPAESDYIKDMSQQFEQFFGEMPSGNEQQLMRSLVGTIELMKKHFTATQQQTAAHEFIKLCFGPAAQMIDADDPEADFKTKMPAVDYLLDHLGMKNHRNSVLQLADQYEKAYHAKSKKVQPLAEAEVQAQLRKGMPHLHDLKAADFLDLVDEIHDGNGRFQLANIPLNVKVDGMGGRFGKSADGRPFMATSRTEPRYVGGFLKGNIARFKKRILAQQNGIADPKSIDDSDPSLASITDQQALDAMGPDSVAMSKKFDEQFNDYMDAIKIVDDNLGDHFLVNRQVTCEVLDINFATETPEGKLKFVGIHYDKLPEGVKIVLVPFRVTDATTGKDLPDTDRIIQQLTSLGQQGKIMFLSNKLQQKQPLDVTEIINILDNVEELKSIVSNIAGKRDHASLQLRREVEAKLEPVKIALEKAIINDPNIIGKDMLGQNYEGIVINSRLGPIKVTSQEQRDVISAKNAAKASTRTERPRGESKTAVVAIGSAIGHIGHQQLFNHAIQLAKQNGGDPYLFLGNAEGKDDPIPVSDKLKTWHMLYPQYANHIGTVTMEGGTLLQKVKHELINPLKDKPPRYDTIYIVVGKDREGMANQMSAALMKAVNKFQGYEHVRVIPEVTERDAAAGGTGVSFTTLRKALKNQSPEQAFAAWDHAFNTGNFGAQRLSPDWIKHLMDVSRRGMGVAESSIKHANRMYRMLREMAL